MENNNQVPYLIITSEVLVSWSLFKDRLSKYYSLTPTEKTYLYDKTKLLFKGLASEESVFYDYRTLLKRNMYEELYISLDSKILRWIEKNHEKFNFILLTQLKNYRACFKEHLALFDKIFCSYEYNKHFSDDLFLKTIFSYAYHDVKNPAKIHVMTSFDFIAKKFKKIDYNIHIHLLDSFHEEKSIEERKKKTLEEVIS